MNRQKQIVRASARGEREGKRERASERERESNEQARGMHNYWKTRGQGIYAWV